MTGLLAPPIVHVDYRSTNFWVVGAGPSRLLIDTVVLDSGKGSD